MSMFLMPRPAAAGFGKIDLNNILGRGFDFGDRFLEAWEKRGVARYTQQLPYFDPYAGAAAGVARQPSAEEIAALLQAQRQQGQGIGLGIDSQGIRLSDGSHIGWFPVIGVLAALYLIQSPSFSRTRR